MAPDDRKVDELGKIEADTTELNDDEIDKHLQVTSRNIDLSHRISVLLRRMEGKEGMHMQDMQSFVDARKKYMHTKDSGHSVFAYDVSHFLFLSYKPKYWYWEGVETMRRLLMSAGLAMVYSATSYQILLGLLVGILFYLGQCFHKPFINEEINNLASIGHQQHLVSLFIAISIRSYALVENTSGLGYATRSFAVKTSLDGILVVVNMALLANLMWYGLDRLVSAIFEKSLRCLGLYHGDKQSAKVSQAPNLADIEATDTRSPWHKNRSVLDSSVPSKADRAIKFNEISQYEDEKVGFSAPLGKATTSRASGGSIDERLDYLRPDFYAAI